MDVSIHHLEPTIFSRHERFKLFAQASGEIFDVHTAAGVLGLSQIKTSKVLARWQKQGFIFRIKKGLYTIMPIDTASQDFTLENRWAIIPKIFDPCYVGGFSAAEHWDLTEQIFNSICIFTTKVVSQQKIKITNQDFLVRHIQPNRLFGLKPIWFKQEKVMISDIHRTIIDIFDNPENGGGIQHAIDCLKNYLNKPEANPEKLVEYAYQLKNGAVYKRLGFLLSVFSNTQAPYLVEFRKNITEGYAYLDPKQKEDVKLIRRWNLFIPTTLDLGADS